ncbi:NACHT domain-containing protein [Streptomyces sp. FL07-04A]|uniref:NACHT domain-containing protein n=1 Tax=Streptomyces sp. FL07-04A TaxID=3028658 RepID=UPI0029B60799|nr:NACHT domain-containing protein [Streptomyces sp. FL07-04A]MDX3575516.1 NACHT domain-containing protein [Streptomyces sp. FL07-04A]
MTEESQGGLSPVAQFAAWLVELKVRSGDPTLERLSRLSGEVPRGHQVPKSTLGKALQGRSLPSLDVAVAIAQACVLHAGGTGTALSAVRKECADRWFQANSSLQVAKISRHAAGEPLKDSERRAALQQHSEAEEAFLAKYYPCMTASLDRMELFGVTLRQQDFSYRMSTSYISLSAVQHDSQSRWHLQAAPAPASGKDGDRGPLRVEDAVARSRRVLIRGDAGSGKTTLLKWIAVGAMNSTLPAPMAMWNRAVPFFIPLRHFTRELPTPEQFLDYAARTLAAGAPQNFVRNTLDSGHAILLIDGVDELPSTRRGEVRDWLRELTSSYEKCRYVITSRQAAIGSGWLADTGFLSLELTPMSLSDQNLFISHWHDTMRSAVSDEQERVRLREHEKALVRSMAERRELRRLGSNPLLCALLCALHWDREMHLPSDRLKLFEAALEMLLVRRDQQRNIAGDTDVVRLSSGVQELILRKLAYWMIRNDFTEVAVEQMTERVGSYLRETPDSTLDPAAVTQHLLVRTGLLRAPAVGRVDFVHRTFQEYLAADQILNDDDLGFLIRHAHEDLWQDVVVMASGRARDSERNQLVKALLKRARRDRTHRVRLIVLAVDCAGSAPSLAADLRRETQARAQELIPPQDRKQAEALACLGEVALDQMPEPGAGLGAHELQAILHTCRLVGGTAAMRVLAGYGRYFDRTIERPLIEMWRDFDRGEYARVVLSALSEIDSLTVDAELLPHLSGVHNLVRLRIDGPVPGYEVVERLEGLEELTLVNPAPELSGFSAPAGLRSLSVIGRVGHGTLQRLLLPSAEKLHLEIKGSSRSSTSWSLVSGMPEVTRRSLTEMTTDCPLSQIEVERLSTDFPALRALSVRPDYISSIDQITFFLERLKEHTDVTTFRISVADPDDLRGQLAQSTFVHWKSTNNLDSAIRRCEVAFTRRSQG